MKGERELTLTTWLIWAAAASLPLLIGRNPFPLAVVLAAVATVRVVHADRNPHVMGWSLVIKAGLFLAAVSVLFNVLTVRAGDLVIVTLPPWTRWLSGELTWNAVIYGLLSAAAILGLIVTWATAAAAIDWAGLTRILPDRLLGFAVGGSIALNLIPQTVASIGEIREAAAARGFAVRGPRTFATIVSPVVSGSMERALGLTEVLEARGFGSHPPIARNRQLRHQISWNAMLAGSCVAIYAVVVGANIYAAVGLAAALASLALLLSDSRGTEIRRTRYRTETRTRADWLVIGGALTSAIAYVVARSADVRLFAYEPYPTVEMPVASVWHLLGLFGLFGPAIVSGRGEATRD